MFFRICTNELKIILFIIQGVSFKKYVGLTRRNYPKMQLESNYNNDGDNG